MRATWFITISNQPFFGGGMRIAPFASPADGQLNMTVVHDLSRLKFLFIFITVFFRKHHKFKEVSSFTGKRMSIVTPYTLPVHADGELIGVTPTDVHICMNCWKLLQTIDEHKNTSLRLFQNNNFNLTKKL
ncbi:diacylglycerol/lipid kinase family protein [Heyndrickxia ginsengihumi]|uniref:diacylglycerol/lipid kinase family protein n=2 Tax=Heyndrickxia ginsengihumi TaxID=363870 RepID=UPI0022AFDAAA|nr:hypothetical protein [Heyndrickxia ginsengihumi]